MHRSCFMMSHIIYALIPLDEQSSLEFRWSNEASAALEELKKTKKALQEISGNVKCLVCFADYFIMHSQAVIVCAAMLFFNTLMHLYRSAS